MDHATFQQQLVWSSSLPITIASSTSSSRSFQTNHLTFHFHQSCSVGSHSLPRTRSSEENGVEQKASKIWRNCRVRTDRLDHIWKTCIIFDNVLATSDHVLWMPHCVHVCRRPLRGHRITLRLSQLPNRFCSSRRTGRSRRAFRVSGLRAGLSGPCKTPPPDDMFHKGGGPRGLQSVTWRPAWPSNSVAPVQDWTSRPSQ